MNDFWRKLYRSKLLQLHAVVFLIPGATYEQDKIAIFGKTWGNYFEHIQKILNENLKSKARIEVLSVPQSQPIEVAAILVAEKIKAQKESVILIGHSMGGIIARVVMARPEVKSKILGLITIGAPHHGTRLVDWLLEKKDAFLWPKILSILNYDLDSVGFLPELSEKFIDGKFNILFPDNKNIYSIQCAKLKSDQNFYFQITSSILNSEHIKNSDGLVSYESQLWGEKIVQRCTLDHLEQLGYSSSFSKSDNFKNEFEKIWKSIAKKILELIN